MSERPRPAFSVAVVGSLPACDGKPEGHRACARLAAWLVRLSPEAGKPARFDEG